MKRSQTQSCGRSKCFYSMLRKLHSLGDYLDHIWSCYRMKVELPRPIRENMATFVFVVIFLAAIKLFFRLTGRAEQTLRLKTGLDKSG